MQVVLDGTVPAKRKNRLQQRFDKLCREVERRQRDLARFRKALDELTTAYEQDRRAQDQAQLDTLVALAERLIVFASRKSLANWHRDEIAVWLGELIFQRIASVDDAAARRLGEDYREAIAALLGTTPEALDEEYRRHQEALHQAEEDELEPEEYEEDPQGELFGFDELEEEHDSAGEASDGPEFQWEALERETPSANDIMNGSWARSLFRRAAQQLHPDRERDPQARKSKQKKMAALLTARKEGDILTVLKIYREVAGEGDIGISEKEMQAVCDVLEEQVRSLENQKMEYAHAHPLRSVVYELFYDSSRKKREQARRQWREDMDMETRENRRLVAELRNLTVLKAVLRARYDRRYDVHEAVLEVLEEAFGMR